MQEGEEAAASPPSARGWYPAPGQPGYQRFWDGQKWTSHRYWGVDPAAAGGASTPPAVPASPGAPRGPAPGPWRPSPDAPPQYRGFFDVPFNPRSPSRYVASACLFVALLVLASAFRGSAFGGSAWGRFPWQLVALSLGLTVLSFVLFGWRRWRNPARWAAIREPILFSAKVWVRFTYVPNWMYPSMGLGRWDLAVRADTFQITRWMYGNRDGASSTFFNGSETTMWPASVGGRDCIVVSGPTYNRAKVEFAFSAGDGNEAAWNALASAGVIAVAGPAAPPTSPPDAAIAPTSAFRRVGANLGSTPLPGAPAVQAASLGPFGRPRRRAISTAQGRTAMIAVGVLFLALFPLLTILMRDGVVPLPGPAGVLSQGAVSQGAVHPNTEVQTTQCAPSATPGGPVEWTGTLTANAELEQQRSVEVRLVAVTANRAVAGQTVASFPITAASGLVQLGPAQIPVAGASGPLQCEAAFVYPDGLG
jgi:hypothetical protein